MRLLGSSPVQAVLGIEGVEHGGKVGLVLLEMAPGVVDLQDLLVLVDAGIYGSLAYRFDDRGIVFVGVDEDSDAGKPFPELSCGQQQAAWGMFFIDPSTTRSKDLSS